MTPLWVQGVIESLGTDTADNGRQIVGEHARHCRQEYRYRNGRVREMLVFSRAHNPPAFFLIVIAGTCSCAVAYETRVLARSLTCCDQ